MPFFKRSSGAPILKVGVSNEPAVPAPQEHGFARPEDGASGLIQVDLAAGPPGFYRAGLATELIVFWYHDWPLGQVLSTVAPGTVLDLAALAQDTLPQGTSAAAAALAQETQQPHDPRSLSVVICTRDRAVELERCLASLPFQTRPPDQIVVVDNASRDDGHTRRVAEAAGVTYIREDRPGLDIARNAGVRAATGDIILFTDDDVRLHPRWAERLARALDAEKGVWAVTGLVLPAELATPAQVHFEKHWAFGRGYQPIGYGRDFFASDRWLGCPAWEIGAGASMGFLRETFSRVGLFDERLDVGAAGCSGDSEFWHRLLTHGLICRYEPSSVAYHYHRREFDGLARQIRAYMSGHSAALLVQFERSRNLGNLRRLMLKIPYWYARRLVFQLWRGSPEADRLLGEEIRGFWSGIAFYLRTPRPPEAKL
jgi:GT2 family glycosyltransferase